MDSDSVKGNDDALYFSGGGLIASVSQSFEGEILKVAPKKLELIRSR